MSRNHHLSVEADPSVRQSFEKKDMAVTDAAIALAGAFELTSPGEVEALMEDLTTLVHQVDPNFYPSEEALRVVAEKRARLIGSVASAAESSIQAVPEVSRPASSSWARGVPC